jgi:hypothetical protein
LKTFAFTLLKTFAIALSAFLGGFVVATTNGQLKYGLMSSQSSRAYGWNQLAQK